MQQSTLERTARFTLHLSTLVEKSRKSSNANVDDIKNLTEEVEMTDQKDKRLPILNRLMTEFCPALSRLEKLAANVPDQIEVATGMYRVRSSVKELGIGLSDRPELKVTPIQIRAKAAVVGLQEQAAKIINQLFIRERTTDTQIDKLGPEIDAMIGKGKSEAQAVEEMQKAKTGKKMKLPERDRSGLTFLNEAPQSNIAA